MLGPFFIPGYTASYTDFLKQNINFEQDNNLYINPLLADTLIGVLVNEINWFVFGNSTPLLIDNIIYSTSLRLENMHIKVYKY